MIDLFTQSGEDGLRLVRGKLADVMPIIVAHHYTKRRTADPMHVFMWVDSEESIKAAAVFTSPVNRFFGKGAIELSRLVRVPDLTVPLTKFIALCLRWLKKHTRLLFCLSYADQSASHHGGIYQAANFTHVAVSQAKGMWRNDESGALVSERSFDQRSPASRVGFSRVKGGRKYLYVFPLRQSIPKILERFEWKALPYPKPGMLT